MVGRVVRVGTRSSALAKAQTELMVTALLHVDPGLQIDRVIILDRGARIGTSSARRVAFLKQARPDLMWAPIRGNAESRLRKLREGQYDALVLARAGLRRLSIDVPHVVLEPDLLPPAAAVRAERYLMLLLDGGCRLPVGALGTPGTDGGLDLLGGLATDAGGVAIARAHGLLAMPELLADQLASVLRARRADVTSGVLEVGV